MINVDSQLHLSLTVLLFFSRFTLQTTRTTASRPIPPPQLAPRPPSQVNTRRSPAQTKPTQKQEAELI